MYSLFFCISLAFFSGAVFTAHGSHLILTYLSFRAHSTGPFVASMIRVQHRHPTRGTRDPLTSIVLLCRLYLISVSTNIELTSHSLSRLRRHDIIVVVTRHFNLRCSCLQHQKHELVHSLTISKRENIGLCGRYVPVKSQMSKSRRTVGEATRL